MNGGGLNQLRARLAVWLTLRICLTVIAVAGAIALAEVLADAVLDLSDGARSLAPWLVGIGVALVILQGLLGWRWLTELRAARLFESHEPAVGNRLSNAVQFENQTGASAVGEFLRRETMLLGRNTAAKLKTWPVMRSAVVMSAAGAGAVALGWLCCGLLGGDLLQAVVPRFLDPHGDHPPFSRLKIEVTPGHAEVLYGGQVEVKAKTSGRPADKLWLVAKSGTNINRAIMFLAPDKTFFQTLANLREPTDFFVTDGAARSHRLPITIRYTPQITQVEVTTIFPEYTGKPPRTAKLGEEAQALPEGTRINFRVASNRPLKSGALTLTPVLGGKAITVPLPPSAQTSTVAGSFTLAEPVWFSLTVSDVDGLSSLEPRKGRFNILPDERPRIFVLEPGRDAVATPSIHVPVRVQATDDYAVTRVVWLRGHNQSIERPLNLKLTSKNGPQSVEAAGAFELDKLGVRPGDVIEYYFEAADNYPKGPNVTVSRFYRLEIISEEQYLELLRQEAARQALFEPYFKLNSWLQRLAEQSRELEHIATAGSDAQKQSLAADTQALSADLEKYLDQLGKLLGEATMFDVEKSFRETLVTRHTRVTALKDKLKQLAASGQLSASNLGEISDELNKLAATGENEVGQPARQIASVARLMARADTFVKLAEAQAELAKSLRRFGENTNNLSRMEQMEVQELARQQRMVQQGLRELLAGLSASLNELPAEPQYDVLRQEVTNFLAAVADAKIETDLGDAAKLLGDLDAAPASVIAQVAADEMAKLISKCNSVGDKAGQCLHFQPKVQQAMGNTLKQILAAMGSGPRGQGGQNGYSLFNRDVGLYGPAAELAGEQGGKRGGAGSGAGHGGEPLATDAADPGLKAPAGPGRVRMQLDAKFPLRYRDLVGDYFRAIAESEDEGEKKP